MSDKYDWLESLEKEVDRFQSTNTFTAMHVTHFYAQARCCITELKESREALERLAGEIDVTIGHASAKAERIIELEYLLHRIAASDIIKWDADTQEEYEREFMVWVKRMAKKALGLDPDPIDACEECLRPDGYHVPTCAHRGESNTSNQREAALEKALRAYYTHDLSVDLEKMAEEALGLR